MEEGGSGAGSLEIGSAELALRDIACFRDMYHLDEEGAPGVARFQRPSGPLCASRTISSSEVSKKISAGIVSSGIGVVLPFTTTVTGRCSIVVPLAYVRYPFSRRGRNAKASCAHNVRVEEIFESKTKVKV